jgi:hypothetical protein
MRVAVRGAGGLIDARTRWEAMRVARVRWLASNPYWTAEAAA